MGEATLMKTQEYVTVLLLLKEPWGCFVYCVILSIPRDPMVS